MKQALEGIKIADFSWAITGPLATKWLADHGATVVKIESMQRVDVERNFIPMAQGIAGINRCGSFAQYNTGKLSLALNLNLPKAREVARQLVNWADVVVENFGVGVMEKWKLDYESIKQVKTDIIMISSTLQGRTGPHSRQGGLGILMQGLAGFTLLVGWPDRSPTGVSTPYTDYIGPWYLITAIVAALDHRRRTGEGQFVDMSQFEASLHFLSPEVLDYVVNKRIQNRSGNRSPYAAPHGVFRCKGVERWCAIAVFSDSEWGSFCGVMGNPAWCEEPRFATLLARKRNEDELERLVNEWTINQSAEDLMARLQAVGVCAGVVENAQDISNDPQLTYRGHLEMVEHTEMGRHACERASFRLSKTTALPLRPAPLLGQHTEYVCTELLGMSDEEFVKLLNNGVFE